MSLSPPQENGTAETTRAVGARLTPSKSFLYETSEEDTAGSEMEIVLSANEEAVPECRPMIPPLVRQAQDTQRRAGGPPRSILVMTTREAIVSWAKARP